MLHSLLASLDLSIFKFQVFLSYNYGSKKKKKMVEVMLHFIFYYSLQEVTIKFHINLSSMLEVQSIKPFSKN